MNHPQTAETSEAAADAIAQELVEVSQTLREAQKVLRRDWEQLTPRQRSEHTRRVKELEQQAQALQDELAMRV